MTTILTPDEVTTIKSLIWSGQSQSSIAQRYGVTPAHISRISRGHIYYTIKWPDGTEGPLPLYKVKENHATRHRQTRVEHAQSAIANLTHQERKELEARLAQLEGQQEDASLEQVVNPSIGWDDCSIILSNTKLLKRAVRSPKLREQIMTIAMQLPVSQRTAANLERLVQQQES